MKRWVLWLSLYFIVVTQAAPEKGKVPTGKEYSADKVEKLVRDGSSKAVHKLIKNHGKRWFRDGSTESSKNVLANDRKLSQYAHHNIERSKSIAENKWNPLRLKALVGGVLMLGVAGAKAYFDIRDGSYKDTTGAITVSAGTLSIASTGAYYLWSGIRNSPAHSKLIEALSVGYYFNRPGESALELAQIVQDQIKDDSSEQKMSSSSSDFFSPESAKDIVLHTPEQLSKKLSSKKAPATLTAQDVTSDLTIESKVDPVKTLEDSPTKDAAIQDVKDLIEESKKTNDV